MADESIYDFEVLAWIPDNKVDFFIEQLNIIETTTSDISIADVAGLLVKTSGAGVTPILDGDEANVDGIVLRPVDGESNALDLAGSATSSEKFFVLREGPALVNEDKLLLTDVADDTIDLAAIKTALEALSIKTVSEPQKTETQDIT